MCVCECFCICTCWSGAGAQSCVFLYKINPYIFIVSNSHCQSIAGQNPSTISFTTSDCAAFCHVSSANPSFSSLHLFGVFLLRLLSIGHQSTKLLLHLLSFLLLSMCPALIHFYRLISSMTHLGLFSDPC